MNTPIQKLIEILELSQLISENQEETQKVFSTLLTLISDMKLIELEETIINKAYTDGRFYRRQIDKMVNNYYEENYNNK
jgi:hypothetical protein